ncbi:PfkB family carbohydrate kinase [Pseudarthrobacter sp. J75]|uniref:1-phosphofructokinase family hexose kinase n=1 Tax=unclassified Pseudarthrobacter TaxID=2647000 RepID=UPI002E80B828|nr:MULTISPECIES: PfkB family carbohydrate kinase [unclassified Pseudarthrobacter]MEE2523791.1 PfkB family carbohydrate kinase [Pseudarthrobacter sp. J47]MEE2529957.1 PfkB family carbohydrate kinase [Pseudarthrobacter sp. J75]
MGAVVVFAPSPVLTVTVEDIEGTADIHIHAGGQGVWQARMLTALGATVTMCAAFSGETGLVLRHLIADEGVRVLDVTGEGSSGTYLHDRRGGERKVLAESPGYRLTRHELDELYGLTLQAGIEAGTVILSGSGPEDAVPPDTYRRLTADLGAAGCTVIADLADERLDAVLAGKPAVIKIADDEMVASGRALAADAGHIINAMHNLAREGAAAVIVTRANLPSLLLSEGEISEVRVPELQTVDTSGAGDSLTAGIAAVLAENGSLHEAVVLGTAAGAQNVTRHGLGTGEATAIRELAGLVTIVPLEDAGADGTAQQMSPDDLARKVRRS